MSRPLRAALVAATFFAAAFLVGFVQSCLGGHS